MRIVTREQMKQLEENALRFDLTFSRLMENAGSAAAAFIRRTLPVAGKNCMVFCSSGNNGGDGLVVARKLAENGANVVIVLLDGAPRSQESASMFATVQLMELPVVEFSQNIPKVLSFLEQTDIVVDAICGTGFHGSLRQIHREACRAINSAIAAVVSLDLPSGVDCDTGEADHDAIQADFTVVFDSYKPIHQLAPALCGIVEVVDIGIPAEAAEGMQFSQYGELPASAAQDTPAEPLPELPAENIPKQIPLFDDTPQASPVPQLQFVSPSEEPPAQPEAPASAPPQNEFAETPATRPPKPQKPRVITLESVMMLLPPRPVQSHKGDFGTLLNISGCQNYRGAAVLSTLAALHSGAGLVTLASTGEVCTATAAHILESTYLPLPQSAVGGIDYEGALPLLEPALKKANAVLFGCGLGNTSHTVQLLAWLLQHATCPLIVDADGINALAQNIHVLHKASTPVILTPHPGEMARLCGVSTEDIVRDRQGLARQFAQVLKVTMVLKGHETLVACQDGTLLLNPTGNPGLAKGGSGDVLAGMVGAFLAQGLAPEQAAMCAVYLHGLAADRTARRRSQYAMLPSELLDDLALILLENGR